MGRFVYECLIGKRLEMRYAKLPRVVGAAILGSSLAEKARRGQDMFAWPRFPFWNDETTPKL